MIRKMTGIALCLFGCSVVCLGIIVTSFSDIDTYLKRGNNIVIAKAFSIPTNAPVNLGDGLHLVEVEIVRTLKGTNQPGRQIIATIYPLNSGRDFLLYSLGGSAGGTSFLAVPELSVVELPLAFDLRSLDEKPLREQILLLFGQGLSHVKKALAEKSTLTFSRHDKDRQILWAKLKTPTQSDGVTEYLIGHLSTSTQQLLSKYNPPFRSGNEEVVLSQALAEDLNRIIRNGPIYDAQRFAGVELSAEASKLLRQNPHDGVDLMRLNAALLLDAYPAGLSKDPELDEKKRSLEKATRDFDKVTK